jgi:hypothetical protein
MKSQWGLGQLACVIAAPLLMKRTMASLTLVCHAFLLQFGEISSQDASLKQNCRNLSYCHLYGRFRRLGFFFLTNSRMREL